jgi:hypothetical protein
MELETNAELLKKAFGTMQRFPVPLESTYPTHDHIMVFYDRRQSQQLQSVSHFTFC